MVLLAPLAVVACATGRKSNLVLYRDRFEDGLSNWLVELERPGRVAVAGGMLEIDVPAGATIWFREEISGPVVIRYDTQMIGAGGVNDRVSDLNAFWMARDPRAASGSILDRKRSGAFADYDELMTYYVGQGGNANTTTRFRRYIGRRDDRPLLPENDLRDAADLLVPNRWQQVKLVADGERIEYWRDDRRLFSYRDSMPYARGHFGLRTTASHLRIRDFRIERP